MIMNAVGLSEEFETMYRTILHHIREDNNVQEQRCFNALLVLKPDLNYNFGHIGYF